MKNLLKQLVGVLLLVFLLSIGTTYVKAESQKTPNGFVPKSTYLSPEKQAPITFTGLAADWHQEVPEGTTAKLSVHVKFLDGSWSDWYDLTADLDGFTEADQQNPSAFLPFNQANGLQYKIELQSINPKLTPVVENIKFTYLNANDKATDSSTNLFASSTDDVAQLAQTISNNASTDLHIISRSEWGADESLRIYNDTRPPAKLITTEPDFQTKYADELKLSNVVDKTPDGKYLTWPLQYAAKVSKFVIHHTATTKNLDNPKQAIRDIYYWHAISKGWGDIGYNYIVDPQGNIYEGRYGGDGVVGAHAGPANVGSIGIAVLGNYQDNDVPEPVLRALSNLIRVKAAMYGIDPAGTSMFRGENSPNVIGHRDVMKTSCPGDHLYALLPVIRLAAKGALKPKFIDRRRVSDTKYDFDLANDLSLFHLDPATPANITLTFKNTGTEAWNPDTFVLLSKDNTSLSYMRQTDSIISNKAGTTVSPGQTVDFTLALNPGYKGGIVNLEFFLLVNGSNKIEKYLSLPVQITPPIYDYDFNNATFTKPYLEKGQFTDIRVELKNTGNLTWYKSGANRIMLGTQKPQDHVSKLLPKPSTRLATLEEDSVPPGSVGHFRITLKAPKTVGSIKEYYAPVMEGLSWLPFKGNYLEFFVYEKQLAAQFIKVDDNLNFLPGETRPVNFEFMNMGGKTWNVGNDSLHFIISGKDVSASNISVDKTQINPGEIANVTVNIGVPSTEGDYKFNITPKYGDVSLIKKSQTIKFTVAKQSSSVASAKPVSNGKPNMVRVDLSYKGNPVISGDGPFKLVDGDETIHEYSANDKVAVTYEQQKYVVRSNGDTETLDERARFEPIGTTILRIDNYAHQPAWNQSLNDNTYRGSLEVWWYQDQLTVVNELPIEDYLKGLAEIDPKQPYEKIKAVIILARSYAQYYTTIARKFPGAPYDLTDDPARSQFYLGYGFESRTPTVSTAVADTSNLVVTYNGTVIKTPYFSSDDGRTRSAQEVWGWTDTPYLQSVADPGCQGMQMAGHGVGLSGCGALYFANQGKKYDEIIKYYFQGVQIATFKK